LLKRTDIINYSYLKVSGPKKIEIHILNIMINFMKKIARII
jgi:hypothetical protein